MRKAYVKIAALLAALTSSAANAVVLSGTITVTINGTLRVTATGFTTVDCNANAIMVPTTGSATTLANVVVLPWLRGAYQQANAHASWVASSAGSFVTGVAPTSSNVGSVTGFRCVVVVPYTFTNAVAGQNSIAITYSAKATDFGGLASGVYVPPSYPGGKTQQVVNVVAPPTNPGAINVTVQPKI